MDDKVKEHIENLYAMVDLQSERIDNLVELVNKIEKELINEKKVSNILLDKYIEPIERDARTLAKAYKIIESKDAIIQAKDELIGSMFAEIEELKNRRPLIVRGSYA